MVELGFKLTHKDFPFFNIRTLDSHAYALRPFLFTNVAILIDEFKPQTLSANLKDATRLSAGFGLQLLFDGYTSELYYTMAAKKESYEFGTEFQFNFGN